MGGCVPCKSQLIYLIGLLLCGPDALVIHPATHTSMSLPVQLEKMHFPSCMDYKIKQNLTRLSPRLQLPTPSACFFFSHRSFRNLMLLLLIFSFSEICFFKDNHCRYCKMGPALHFSDRLVQFKVLYR